MPSVPFLKRNSTGKHRRWNEFSTIDCHFSKEETDQEAVDIRQKCEDYVLSINDLQSEVLVIKTPIRRVKNRRLFVTHRDGMLFILDLVFQSRHLFGCDFLGFRGDRYGIGTDPECCSTLVDLSDVVENRSSVDRWWSSALFQTADSLSQCDLARTYGFHQWFIAVVSIECTVFRWHRMLSSTAISESEADSSSDRKTRHTRYRIHASILIGLFETRSTRLWVTSFV